MAHMKIWAFFVNVLGAVWLSLPNRGVFLPSRYGEAIFYNR